MHIHSALVTPGHYEDPSTAVGHVYEKLLHIKSRLKTEPGKRRGDARHKFVSQFIVNTQIISLKPFDIVIDGRVFARPARRMQWGPTSGRTGDIIAGDYKNKIKINTINSNQSFV